MFKLKNAYSSRVAADKAHSIEGGRRQAAVEEMNMSYSSVKWISRGNLGTEREEKGYQN